MGEKTKPKILLLALTLAIILFLYSAKRNFIKEQETPYLTKASVLPTLEKIGVSTDVDKIDFGVVAKGMDVRKVIYARSNETFLTRIEVRVYGNISPFIEVAPKNLFLKPNENQTINLKFVAREVGNYTGKIVIKMKTPRYEFLERFLKWI